MKKLPFLFLFAAFFAACGHDGPSVTPLENNNGLALLTEANPEWQYENLRLYPVVAENAAGQEGVQQLKTLAEGMETPGFRITELKQFGRTREHSVNMLTVQNKSDQAILMLSGDVVVGGNQDRVIAQDQVVMPGTVRNVDVFCVEKGRWRYDDAGATQSEKNIYAFKGYYNVASPQVRQAVQRTGNQAEVWNAVAKVTSANAAESGTQAYTALETAGETKQKRDDYLRYFNGKLTDVPNVVGMVAVCGDRVLGIDVFGHPDLFKREYNSLLHGYVAEAATATAASRLADEAVQVAFSRIAPLASAKATPTEQTGVLHHNGAWVHLFSK